jgi:hypothetical protein
MPLERAVWLSRALYGIIALAVTLTGRARWRVDPTFLGIFAACTLLVAHSYKRLSYELIIWDREWHIPLVSMLRVSKIPFENVYSPLAPLRYHWMGDVIPAMLQTLSGDRIHSTLALSLVHDLYLALTASMMAWAVYFSAGLRRWWVALTAPLFGLAATLGGPFVLFNVTRESLFTERDSARLCGTSYLNYATLAYRPHVVLAGFFVVSVFVALMERTREATRTTASTRSTATLLLSAAVLALLDEATLAVLPVALGVCWLAVPTALHRRWYMGPIVVAAMGSALPVVSEWYGGSLAQGGPAREWELVATRHLELFETPVTLLDREAFYEVFSRDYLPCYAVALLVLAMAVWTRRRDLATAAVFYCTLCAVSWALAFRFEVNHKASEGHRFITAMIVLAPVVGSYAVASVRDAMLLRGLLLLVVVATATSTLAWRDSFVRHRFEDPGYVRERDWVGPQNPYLVDCRDIAGPLRRAIHATYIDQNDPMIYAGCAPMRMVGPISEWGVSVGPPLHTYGAVRAYRADRSDLPREVLCNTEGPILERGCAWARENLTCTPLANGPYTRCSLPPARVRDFLEHLDW